VGTQTGRGDKQNVKVFDVGVCRANTKILRILALNHQFNLTSFTKFDFPTNSSFELLIFY
jgi:hypothetical protein